MCLSSLCNSLIVLTPVSHPQWHQYILCDLKRQAVINSAQFEHSQLCSNAPPQFLQSLVIVIDFPTNSQLCVRAVAADEGDPVRTLSPDQGHENQ